MKSNRSTFLVLLVLAIIATSTGVNAQETPQETPQDTLQEKEPIHLPSPNVVSDKLYVLDVPEGFSAMDSTEQSYHHKQIGAVVQLVQIENTNMVNMRMGFTPEYFEKNQMTKISEQEIKTNSGLGAVIYKSKFTLKGTEFIRYSAISGGLNSSVWVNFTYTANSDIILEAEVIKCFKSIRLNTTER